MLRVACVCVYLQVELCPPPAPHLCTARQVKITSSKVAFSCRLVPRRASIDGTPLDTSSCALWREGREPRGCRGLALAPRFLKLVAIRFLGSEFKITILLPTHKWSCSQWMGVVCRKSARIRACVCRRPGGRSDCSWEWSQGLGRVRTPWLAYLRES